jgi:GGDEF domain-containing protein
VSAWEDGTTWYAIGVAAFAVALLVVGALLVRRVRARRPAPHKNEGQSDRPIVADLTAALERARQDAARAEMETEKAKEERDRASTELRWLRQLSEIGTTVDLEGILQRALEAATHLANAAAAMIVLAREDDEPLIATFGLSPEESSRELLGIPPEGGQARAVTLTYRYSEGEMEFDEFRLRGGLALPILDEGEKRAGTLAIFWRRVERDFADDELGRLEALTAALAPALENAFRFEALRRLADLDPVTGLYSRRFLHEALVRECARARRYERRLSLVLLRIAARLDAELLATAGTRLASAVREADLICHLDDGRFAVLVPEAGLADAERLYRRLQFAVGSKLDGETRIALPAGIVELRPEDDPVSFLRRAGDALDRDEAPGGLGTSTAVEQSG